jgi:PAS domain S-box-containing protein
VNDPDRDSVVLFVGDDARTVRAGRAVERALPGVSVSTREANAVALSAVEDDAVVCVVAPWTDTDEASDSGDSFLAALRARRPSVPVVLFTDADLAAVSEAVAAYDVADVRPRTSDALADELLARSVDALVDGNRGVEARNRATERVPLDDGNTLHSRWYQRLVEQNIVGIYVIEDRAFSYVSPRLADVFRTTPAAMEGRPVMSFVAPEDRSRVRRYLEVREQGHRERAHYVFSGLCADGTRIEVETSGSGVRVDGGVAIAGVLLDVTERERREREVRHLSRAVEHAAPAIYVTDVTGTITYANPSFERITGHSVTEVIGEKPILLNSGRMSDAYYDEMYRTINGGEVWREAIVDRRANGELYHARQTIAPIYDEDRVDGFVAIQEDVTDERIQQQVLQVLHRVLRHNLRNELNVIAGHADELCRRLSERGDDRGVASAEAIQRATTELHDLSERATDAEFTLEPAEADRWVVDLRELLDQQWTRVVDDGVHGLDIDGPDTAPVAADATLAVALRELLDAAVGSADDRAGPTVTIRNTEDEVELRFRLEETVTNEWTPVRTGRETPLEHASGLNTWLVEWVVTRLGGDVQLADGDGASMLTVRLPAADG